MPFPLKAGGGGWRGDDGSFSLIPNSYNAHLKRVAVKSHRQMATAMGGLHDRGKRQKAGCVKELVMNDSFLS